MYQELRDSGFEANSTTYNALISAYGKLGQLERVLEVYKDMVWRGLERRCGLGSWVLLVSPLPALFPVAAAAVPPAVAPAHGSTG